MADSTPNSASDSQEKQVKQSTTDKHETFKTVVIAVAIAILIRSLLFEPFHIPSGSMKSTLLVGDFIYVSKSAYGYSRFSFPLGIMPIKGRIFQGEDDKPQRGDIIVFRLPSSTSIDYIKRLIGLPGDKIQVKNGVLQINGEAVKLQRASEFIEEQRNEEGGINVRSIERSMETLPNGVEHYVLNTDYYGEVDNTPVYTVPEKHYFFMGDNRDQSVDSRYMDRVGFVPEENLVGRAERVVISVHENESLLAFWRWGQAFRDGRFWVDLEQHPKGEGAEK